MTTSANNPNAEALVIAFQKRDDQDADWRKKIAPTVEALEKSAANGGFTWNGKTYTSVKKWVPVALNITYRAWRYRVTGGNPVSKRTKKEGVKPVSPNRVLELKDGTPFKHNGGLFQIDGDISVRESGGELVFTLIGKPTTPAKKSKKEPKTTRLTLRQTYIAINAVRKQVGKDDRTIEWAQRQYDGILALNGVEKKPHYSAYRTALKHAEETLQGRIQHKETEERMAKITHLVFDEEPEFTLCTRRNMRLTTDVQSVECEECREAYERQKKYDALRPVHAAGNIINPDNPRTVRCSSGGSRPKSTDEKEKVTCTNCLRGLDQDEQISWFPDFEKTVPEGVTKNQKDDLWRVYLRARRGSIYDPENVTETPCKDPAEAMDWYRKYVVVVCPSSKEEAQ
ncbi:MAG TPA: hypothetical protein VNH65_01125 [Candidatus Acidoferrum sp.]|nr:hypothetical protein [Candidatus Acidoferrum sp.]